MMCNSVRASFVPIPIQNRRFFTANCRNMRGTMSAVQEKPPIVVVPVESGLADDQQGKLDAFKRLCRSYLAWLGEDLGFQAVDDELDTLPGVYAERNNGVLLVAECDGEYAGTAALRPLRGKQADGVEEIEGISVDDIAELKRLWVDSSFQRRGIGEALTRECLEVARRKGYKAVVCDTLERLTAANALYERIGFKKTMAYSYCPLEGPLHFFYRLSRSKVRCITAFGSAARLEEVRFVLDALKQEIECLGYEVQMTRYTGGVLETFTAPSQAVIDAAKEFEAAAAGAGVLPVSLGSICSGNIVRDSAFLARLLTETRHGFLSAAWQYEWGFNEALALAEAIFAVEEEKPGTNFRFAVSFNCEGKYIPFFPASAGGSADDRTGLDRPDASSARKIKFSLGLENSALLHHAYARSEAAKSEDPLQQLTTQVKAAFADELAPIEKACQGVAQRLDADYKGIDTSIAPDLRGEEHNMAKCVTLPGSSSPFRSGTVATINAITSALRDVPGISTVGYRGVMLPVLENDSLVAAVENNELTVDKLLLYSTVCGVGLDVVPLAAGHTAEEREEAKIRLAGWLLDVAAISARCSKPLSVRVLPCPGKSLGEPTSNFGNKYLVDGAPAM